MRSLDEILAVWDRDAFELRGRIAADPDEVTGTDVFENSDCVSVCINTKLDPEWYTSPPFVDVYVDGTGRWRPIYSGPDAWAVFGLALWVLGCEV